MNTDQIWTLARDVLRTVHALGAEEATVATSRHDEISLSRRAGKLEQATQATSQSLSLSLLANDRFSVHSTSDLRPDALQQFLREAVEATSVLEPEPERRQPERARCGLGATEAELDLCDPGWEAMTVEERRSRALALEAATDALPARDQILSSTCYFSDSRSDSVRVMSNGFEAAWRSSGFGHGIEITLSEPGGRRPEAMSWYSATHLDALPAPAQVAAEAWQRVARRLNSGPAASGRYPMLLDATVVGRILGCLGGPLSGAELHQGRSCLAGKRGEAIASPLLHLSDQPLIRRGLGSRPFDGDGLQARPMPVIEDGVLQNFYINTYYGRKLGMDTTTGGRSNWVVRPGARSPEQILKDLPACILVTGFLGGNSNGLTGDFSFGVQGLLMAHGEVQAHLSEMNVSGNLLQIFHQLSEVASDTWAWSSLRSPSLLFSDVEFSGK